MEDEDYDQDYQSEYQDDDDDEDVPREEIYLSVWHCIGLVVLFLVLGFWSDQLLTSTGNPLFRDITWMKIAITSAFAGLLTAAAGAILAGFSLDDLLPGKAISLGALVSVVLAVFGLTVVSSELGNLFQKLHPLPTDYLDEMARLSRQSFGQQMLAVSVIAPLTEELIFRGVMLEGLRVHYKSTVAMVVSSMLFAFLHSYYQLGVLIILSVGLFLAWLKLNSESLVLCMIAHSLYNCFPDILARLFHVTVQGYNTEITGKIVFQPITFDVIGLACLIAGLVGIYSTYQQMRPDPIESPKPAE